MPMQSPSSKQKTAAELTRKTLAQASYGFSASFLLKLAHHEEALLCETVVRIIPQKRMVFFGRWNNRAVVGKIFFGRHAKQHFQRELAGVRALSCAKVPSPALLHSDSTADKAIQVLIFERLEGAERLDGYYQARRHTSESDALLHALTLELATQHVLGLEQQDLHLNNFLVANEHIYTLDGASIRVHEGTLSKKQSLENLALFFSQLGMHTPALQKRLFKTYVDARSWLVKKSDLRFLQKAIRQWNGTRWQDYSKKIFRSSTPFARHSSLSHFSLHDRAYTSPGFQTLLERPEVFFKTPETRVLKAGRTATVAAIHVDGRRLVVKRYNIKNFWHGLRLFFKPSRARLSWRLAHQLRFAGLPTAKPVAVIEKRFFGLRRTSYFVMEYVEGQRADAFFDAQSHTPPQSHLIAQRIISLFFNLARLRLSHGDLKITNILLTPQQEPVLIDLDGMREHYSSRSLWQRFNKDLARFLENWRERPDLRLLFQEVIHGMKRSGL